MFARPKSSSSPSPSSTSLVESDALGTDDLLHDAISEIDTDANSDYDSDDGQNWSATDEGDTDLSSVPPSEGGDTTDEVQNDDNGTHDNDDNADNDFPQGMNPHLSSERPSNTFSHHITQLSTLATAYEDLIEGQKSWRAWWILHQPLAVAHNGVHDFLLAEESVDEVSMRRQRTRAERMYENSIGGLEKVMLLLDADDEEAEEVEENEAGGDVVVGVQGGIPQTHAQGQGVGDGFGIGFGLAPPGRSFEERRQRLIGALMDVEDMKAKYEREAGDDGWRHVRGGASA